MNLQRLIPVYLTFSFLLAIQVYAQDPWASVVEIWQQSQVLQQNGQGDSALHLLQNTLGQKARLVRLLDSISDLEHNLMRTSPDFANRVAYWQHQVANKQSTKADYRDIAPYLDSLREYASIDTLILWCAQQEKIAVERTQKQLQENIQNLRNNAWISGNFTYLLQRLDEYASLPMLLRQGISTQELRDWAMRQDSLEAPWRDSTFWKNHDPKVVFTQAGELQKQGSLIAARELYMRMLSTSWRSKALAILPSLAEQGCAIDRKKGAELLSKWKKSHARVDLEGALTSLNHCLENFPEHPQRETLLRNQNMLQAELAKDP